MLHFENSAILCGKRQPATVQGGDLGDHGNCRMVLPFTLPAICDSPLSQVTSCTYSRPFASDSGCTVAQPTSVFQNHSEVEGFARFDHWDT